MRATRSILILAVLAAVAAVAPARAEVRYRDPIFAEVDVTPDLAYGEAFDNFDALVPLLLDLYVPSGDEATDRAAIVLAHGGGFTSGSRTDGSITALAREYASRGFVTVSIGYRTRPPGTPGSPTMQDLIVGSLAGELPDAMHDAQHDMQAAIRWMRDNAAELGVDPDLIIAGGISAGASMALETAYNAEDPGESGTPGVPSDIAAAISISGATDPRRIEMGAPAVMLFNGTHDTTAPYPTAVMACGAATALLNVCELQTYVGSGHDLDPHRAEIIDLSTDFLCRHVLSACA